MKLRGRNGHDDTDDTQEGNPVVGLKLKILNELAAAFQNEIHSLGDYLYRSSISGQKVKFDPTRGINLAEEVRRLEIELINYALKCTRGHQREAARLLGLKATTLNAKLKLYGISSRNVERQSAGAAISERENERLSLRPPGTAGEGAYQEIAARAL